MKQDAVDRLTRWSPFLLEGGAVAGTAYLALLVFNQFRETLVHAAAAVRPGRRHAGGPNQNPGRVALDLFTTPLAVTLLPFPLALYVDPWRVLPAALLGSLAPLATFAGSRKTRLLLAVPAKSPWLSPCCRPADPCRRRFPAI
jgi:hypothetical protein